MRIGRPDGGLTIIENQFKGMKPGFSSQVGLTCIIQPALYQSQQL
jgi:hypothetical protein